MPKNCIFFASKCSYLKLHSSLVQKRCHLATLAEKALSLSLQGRGRGLERLDEVRGWVGWGKVLPAVSLLLTCRGGGGVK